MIAVGHPKWVERPLACVVPKPGSALEPAEIIEAVPKTSVGKFDKKVLRERYKNWAPGVI